MKGGCGFGQWKSFGSAMTGLEGLNRAVGGWIWGGVRQEKGRGRERQKMAPGRDGTAAKNALLAAAGGQKVAAAGGQKLPPDFRVC